MSNLILKISKVLTLLLLVAVTPVQAEDNLTQAELDQMLAPVALYPDTVLTHVLIAATYPLEVVQAARWLDNNKSLDAEQAVRATENQHWDPSVKALVAFPQLLQRLSDDLTWTQQLGEAFLADEAAVMASIQQLRERAYTSGNLRNNEQIAVQREREVIVIEPARKEIVYVPVYDTRVVYGDWWWPSHPPVYWHTSGVYYRSSPFYWGVSVRVRPWFYFGIFDWHHHHVVVHHHYYHKPPRYYPVRHKHYVDARRWHHQPEHRRGVHYQHAKLNKHYNHGYGYRQSTVERSGQPARQQQVVHNRSVSVHEDKMQYQRKSADQVKIRRENTQHEHKELRAHNDKPVAQRHVSTAELRERSAQPQRQAQIERRNSSERHEQTERRMQPERKEQQERQVQTARQQHIERQPQHYRQPAQTQQREVANSPQRQQVARNDGASRTVQTHRVERSERPARQIE